MNAVKACKIINKYGSAGILDEDTGKVYSYKARVEKDRISIMEMSDEDLINHFTVDINKLCRLVETKQYKDSMELITLVTIAKMWEDGEVDVNIRGGEVQVMMLK